MEPTLAEIQVRRVSADSPARRVGDLAAKGAPAPRTSRATLWRKRRQITRAHVALPCACDGLPWNLDLVLSQLSF